MGLSAGQIVLESDFQAVRNASDLKPLCRITQGSAGTSLPDNTNTLILFDTDDIDTHGFHSTVSNTSRITPTLAGYYRFTGTLFVPSAGDYATIGCAIYKNGTAVAPWCRIGHNSTSAQRTAQTSAILSMNGSTDYAELMGFQDNTASAARVTPFGSSFAPAFECEFLRGL